MNRYIDEIAQLLPIDAAKKLDKLTVLKVAVETIKYLKGKGIVQEKYKVHRYNYRHDFESFVCWIR